MIRFLKLSIIITTILLSGCKENSTTETSTFNSETISETTTSETLEFPFSGTHPEGDNTLLRVAILGDGEPKPCALFPHMKAAVTDVNNLAGKVNIDFVIGVGDIAHKGTEIQYEAATEVLQKLKPPFYPIMGNEEHGDSVERYLEFAQLWNKDIVNKSYVINHEKLAFIFASPDYSRQFEDSGATWILEQMERLAPKPVILVVHSAQKGVYPENDDKGIENKIFTEQVISQSNLAAVISGDLHMDMDRVNHSKKIGNVHYLHIPALERTKIPDETNHTPMYRVMTITKDGNVNIDTYATGETVPREKHAYSFSLSLPE